MRDLRHDISLHVLKLINVLLMTLPFGICWYLFYADHTAALFARNARLYVLRSAVRPMNRIEMPWEA